MKKIKIIVDEIHGKNCATSFYGFELSRDAIMERLKKRQSLIEVYTDVKCVDGNIYRVFVMINTNRRPNQLKVNSYAKQSKIKLVRKKLIAELQAYGADKKSDTFAFEIITSSVNTLLEKVANTVIPGCKLQVYKMKTVKRGNVDMQKLLKEAKDSGMK